MAAFVIYKWKQHVFSLHQMERTAGSTGKVIIHSEQHMSVKETLTYIWALDLMYYETTWIPVHETKFAIHLCYSIRHQQNGPCHSILVVFPLLSDTIWPTTLILDVFTEQKTNEITFVFYSALYLAAICLPAISVKQKTTLLYWFNQPPTSKQTTARQWTNAD